MRMITIAAGAALLLLPVTVPASACGSASLGRIQAATAVVTTDVSAAAKKKAKKPHKNKEKVEYLRAAPME